MSENSKCRYLVKSKFSRGKYFEDKRFSRSEVELLFSLRTMMVSGIKKKISSQYQDNLFCDLCSAHVDCQEHLLSCATLRSHVDIPNDVQYSDIFGNTDKQLRIVKIFKKLLRAREILQCD